MNQPELTIKLQSASKTKRLAQVPHSFGLLVQTIDSHLRDDRLNPPLANAPRDFYIKYTDGDQELINVSDDEDLRTAYDVAKKELKGNLKFEVGFKKVSVI